MTDRPADFLDGDLGDERRIAKALHAALMMADPEAMISEPFDDESWHEVKIDGDFDFFAVSRHLKEALGKD